jgi:hypothetical protein
MIDKSDNFVNTEICNFIVTWRPPAHVGQQFCVARYVTRSIASARIWGWSIKESFKTYGITLRTESRTLYEGNLHPCKKCHAPFGFRISTG